MKKAFLIFLFLFIAGFVLDFTGCDIPRDDKESKEKEEELSFQDFSPASVIVQNMTYERLVAFKGTVSPGTLISGIPANTANHGLKYDPVLFNATQTFVLILITEAQYNANKNNLAALNNYNQAFAKLFAFYDHSSPGSFSVNIVSALGGTGRLIVNNPTGYNVVLRKDSPYGEAIGYTASHILNDTIFLRVPGDYIIYPVFTRWNPLTQELITAIPTFAEGSLQGQPFMWTFSLADSNSSFSVNVSEIPNQGLTLTSGGAFLNVVNNSLTGVILFNGSTLLATSTGVSVVNSGANNIFYLPFARDSNGIYPNTQSFAQLGIGTNSNRLTVPAQAYMLDYLYEIEITGLNASALQLGAVIEREKVDLFNLIGL